MRCCNACCPWCNFSVMTRSGMSRSDFESLYNSTAVTLLGFFARRTGDPHVARDLWAETFAQAFAGRRRFRGRTGVEAESWLYGIAYRQLAQYHRKGAIEMRALRRLAGEAPPLSDDDIERLQELAGQAALGTDVGEAMQDLPATLRDAVALRVVDELPYDEVARRLGITPQAARVRVSRALTTLRSALPTDRSTQ